MTNTEYKNKGKKIQGENAQDNYYLASNSTNESIVKKGMASTAILRS